MSLLQSTFSRQDWLDRVFGKNKSKRSLNLAKASLTAFDRFCTSKYGTDSESLIKDLRGDSGDKIYIFLSNFVSFLDDKSPRTIQCYFGFIRSYLRSQGIKTNVEDIKEFVKFPSVLKVRRKPLTKDIIQKLLDNSKENRKALYLTLLSSGMRLGEALSLRKKDFDFTKEPVMVSIKASLTKTREARETYISNEAKKLVSDLVKDKKDSDFVFTDNFDIIMSVNLEETIFSELRKRCGFVERYECSNRFVVNIHAFRAYFHTIASRINGTEYANALDGHTSYLGQYYRISSEERIQMYRKLEPHLVIYGDNTEQSGLLKDQIEVRDKEIGKLTNLIMEMKMSLDRREKEFEDIRGELEKLKQWRQISEKYELIKS